MRTRDTTVPRRRTPLTPRTRTVPRWAVAAIGAAAFGLGLAIVLTLTNSPARTVPAAAPSGPATFTLKGTLALTAGQYWSSSGSCTGNEGYTDITDGDHVVVTDQAGQTIGVGQLLAGTVHGQTCVFILGVSVPDGKPFYQVSVAGRGAQTFTAEQAKAGIALSLHIN